MDIKKEKILIEKIIAVVKKAGERTLDFFGTEIDVKKKSDDSPVTRADLISNDILVKELSRYNIPILSEEMAPPKNCGEDFLWIIDPLDGTNSFIKCKDDYSVMVGLTYSCKPILGVVYQPSVDVLYYASENSGAYVEKAGKRKKLKVAGPEKIFEAKLVVSRRAQEKQAFADKIKEIGMGEVHYLSSNGVKIGRIAEGEYDLFFNPSGKLGQWDYCAPHIIFEEAGGVITYLDGGEILYGEKWDENPHGIIASNKELHTNVLKFFT